MDRKTLINTSKKGDLTILKVTGIVTAHEILQQILQYLENTPEDNVLWDFSDASAININVVEMKGIAHSIKKVVGIGTSRKVALAGSGNINIGLGKYFVAVAQLSGLISKYKVFRDIPHAMEWLGRDLE